MALGSKIVHQQLILDVVDECFSDVIRQDTLQEILHADAEPSRYLNPYGRFVFNLLMRLNMELTSIIRQKPNQNINEIRKKTASIIHDFIITSAEEYLFIPDGKNEGLSPQVGVLEHWLAFMENQDASQAQQIFDEKMPVKEGLEALDEKFPEPHVPLTRIDMIRYARYACKAFFTPEGEEVRRNNVEVFSLSELELQDCLPQNWQSYHRAIVIDLNKNKNKPAKWAVLFEHNNEIIFYCESQLLESEKKIIEDLVKKNIKNKNQEIRYWGQTCSSEDCQTSGYAAASFLRNYLFWEKDKKDDSKFNPKFFFNENYDFWSFLQQYFWHNSGVGILGFPDKKNIWHFVCAVAAVNQTYESKTGKKIKIKK